MTGHPPFPPSNPSQNSKLHPSRLFDPPDISESSTSISASFPMSEDSNQYDSRFAEPSATMPPPPLAFSMHYDRHDTTTENFLHQPLGERFFQSTQPLVPFPDQVAVEIDDDNRYLLIHFLQNVAPFVFSILSVMQEGSVLSNVILPQLKSSKAYLHSCLSASALHLKTTNELNNENIDTRVTQHRTTAIQELNAAIGDQSQQAQLLEVIPVIIIFQNFVSLPGVDLHEPSWLQHFSALSHPLNRSDVQSSTDLGAPALFNISLYYWIDIIGATMLGRFPIYSNTYRERCETNTASGLAQLTGCNDNVLYLISEIACLDAHKNTPSLDDFGLRLYVRDLENKLIIAMGPGIVSSVFNPITKMIEPSQLNINVSAIFSWAAHIYLCSLLPEFDREAEQVISLVNDLVAMMNFIPGGPSGFDRALVWPLLIAGSVSVPSSPFRNMFQERNQQLGPLADYGSWSRLCMLLQEVWKLNDCLLGGYIDWRNVMFQKKWKFLLI